MIYKCIKCNKVVYSNEEQLECECKEPKFLPVQKIHLMHELGEGNLITKRKVVGALNNDKGQVVREAEVEELRLCCLAQEKNPIAHITLETVTCKDCIEFIDNYGIVDEIMMP